MQRPAPVSDLDWPPDAAHALGTRAVELWTEWLGRLRALPVSREWKGRDLPRELGLRVADGPVAADELVAFLRRLVMEDSMYPGHPAFMAYITGPGTIPGAVAELIAAALNQNLGGYRLAPAATEIEQFTTRWFARELFGLPEGAGGILVSGGAMASFVALKAARDATMSLEVRARGVAGAGAVAWYASTEAHAVIQRAADMLGLGAGCVREVAVDARGRMDPGALEAAIDADLAAGIRPSVVVATAGTVATGAIDPLPAIDAIRVRHGMWLHVDGAYGALAMLAPELAGQFAGIERADSIAFDPHKWLYVPHSAGCVVVRDLQRLADAFAVHATYVHEDKARSGTGIDLNMLGPQFSRGFQALKIYLSLLAHGRAAYARRIAHDAELARWLGAQVDAHPELERIGEVSLSICCFRYVPPDAPADADREPYLDALNERLMGELQASGAAYCSNAIVGGRFVLRACIVNYRTEAEDVEALIATTVRLGRAIHAQLGGR